MRHVLIFILVLTSFPTLAAEPLRVPVRLAESGHYMADFTVNGEGPFTFIIDTGASGTVIFDQLVEEAGLSYIDDGTIVQVQGASGLMDARMSSLGDLVTGDWAITVDTAVVLPGSPHLEGVYGVLGNSYLFAQPVGFNTREGTLDLYVDEATAETAFAPAAALGGAWTSAPTAHNGTPFLWTLLEVDGVAFEAVIDTGARRSAINSAGAAALGINSVDELAEEDPIHGATGQPEPAWTLPIGTLTLGEAVWTDRTLTLAELMVFRMMGRVHEPAIIIGPDYLAEHYFILDAGAQRLWLQLD